MQFKKMGPQPVTACTGNLQNGPEPIVAYVCLIYLEMAPCPMIASVGSKQFTKWPLGLT